MAARPSAAAWIPTGPCSTANTTRLANPVVSVATAIVVNAPRTARIVASIAASSWPASVSHRIRSVSGATPVGSFSTSRAPSGPASASIGTAAASATTPTAASRRVAVSGPGARTSARHRRQPERVRERHADAVEAVGGEERVGLGVAAEGARHQQREHRADRHQRALRQGDEHGLAAGRLGRRHPGRPLPRRIIIRCRNASTRNGHDLARAEQHRVGRALPRRRRSRAQLVAAREHARRCARQLARRAA